MNKMYNQRVVSVAEAVCGLTSKGEPRPGGGLLSDMGRRIERACDNDLVGTTKAKLISWRGDLLYLQYCVNGGQLNGQDMVTTVGSAAGGYFFVLAQTTNLIHSNTITTNEYDHQSLLDSKFAAMCAELLPKSDLVAIEKESLRSCITPPKGYYLCSLAEKFCSCAYVKINGPFQKVSVTPPASNAPRGPPIPKPTSDAAPS